MLAHLLFDKPAPVPVIEKPVDPTLPKRSNAYGTVRPRVLQYIKNNPDCTPVQICTDLGLNPDSVNRGLRKLREEGSAWVSVSAVQCGPTRSSAQWRAK